MASLPSSVLPRNLAPAVKRGSSTVDFQFRGNPVSQPFAEDAQRVGIGIDRSALDSEFRVQVQQLEK